MPLGAAGTLAPKPVEPVRQYSFTDWQVNNPTAPPPGDRLDAEFDRADGAIGDTVAWVATSLNDDGTLRAGIVGETQMVPGLFDHIADDITNEVQPLVDDAQSAASSAISSSTYAFTSAASAQASVVSAADAATSAGTSRDAAAVSANAALVSATEAGNAAADADNSANHALGDAALAMDWAQVSIEWAEHMPDTIPPNILAIAAVTGDHWSSRWWANRAKSQGDELLTGLQQLYLGAFATAPVTDNLGNPIAIGALYYNLTLAAMYVWTGGAWQPAVQPSPVQTYRYVYVATAGQTVFAGADRDGDTLVVGGVAFQQTAVWENGLLRTPVNDYTQGVNSVTFTTPCGAGDIVQIWVESVPTITLDWRTARLNTTGWVFDGVQTTFPLKDPANVALIVSAASDVILSLDGVWQQATVDYTVASTNLTFATAPRVDGKAFGIAIVPVPDVASPQPGVTSIDTSSWVFDGVNVNFPLLDTGGAPETPVNAENLLLSLNGVWQAAIRDYTVTGSVVTLLSPPEAGSRAFGVVGLPAFGG